MKRALSALLALVLGANGLAMLLAGARWYAAVSGVAQTGPFNGHFVQDIGAAYLVVALGLGWFAAWPRQGWPALVCAAAFLVLHGLIHVVAAVRSPVCGQDLARDFPGVLLPALIAAGLAVLSMPPHGRLSGPTQGDSHADRASSPQYR